MNERITESIRLVKQMEDMGMTSASLTELRERMNDWIRTGDPWAGTIKFPAYGRAADVVLPRRADKAATIHFRAV